MWAADGILNTESVVVMTSERGHTQNRVYLPCHMIVEASGTCASSPTVMERPVQSPVGGARCRENTPQGTALSIDVKALGLRIA